MDDSLIATFVTSLKNLLDATDKKHDDNFVKAKRLNQANLDEIQEFKTTIENEKKVSVYSLMNASSVSEKKVKEHILKHMIESS